MRSFRFLAGAFRLKVEEPEEELGRLFSLSPYAVAI